MLLQFFVFLFVINSLESANWNRNNMDNLEVLFPCKNNKDFSIVFDKNFAGLYYFEVNKVPIERSTVIRLTFSHSVNINLGPTQYVILNYKNPYSVELYYLEAHSKQTTVAISGRDSGILPAITSIIVNGIEECKEPLMYIKDMEKNTNSFRPLQLDSSVNTCGRRQLVHTELITHSITTKPGDWPWHAAIYRKENDTFHYRCGGTLLSSSVVLTAGHCLIEKGVNTIFSKEQVRIYLGKYNLYKKDKDIQEKEVEEMIVHPDFNSAKAENDIALIKLKDNVEFNHYVQPVCLWNDNVLNLLENSNILGTVVGWGFDESDHLSPEIRQATIPMIDRLTCVMSNFLFFGQYLNEFKFCAGYKNGTSACNGDSGGGFVVFVPNDASSNTRSSIVEGSWYIRGIVSVAIARRYENICERNSYILFTDVSKYKDWIETHLDSDTNSGSIFDYVYAEPNLSSQRFPINHSERFINSRLNTDSYDAVVERDRVEGVKF